MISFGNLYHLLNQLDANAYQEGHERLNLTHPQLIILAKLRKYDISPVLLHLNQFTTGPIVKGTNPFRFEYCDVLLYLIEKKQCTSQMAVEKVRGLTPEQAKNLTTERMEIKSSQQGLFANKVEEKKEADIPDYFLCPITREIMEDPVVCMLDGHSYERANITRWRVVNRTSPMNRKQLAHNQKAEDVLCENRNLKQVIEAYKQTLSTGLSAIQPLH